MRRIGIFKTWPT